MTHITKQFLFFIVHPAKYHLFKYTINKLINDGHVVEVLITSKDVLEELVQNESWNYVNIFPEGRKIFGIHTYLSSIVNFFRTILRLHKQTARRKYDLCVTDDLLVFNARFRNIPSLVFTDDDIEVTRLFSIILHMATHVIAPNITNLGPYTKKKLGFNSYKELAYLHPDYFTPDELVLKRYNMNNEKFVLIRLVSLNAYHDVGKSGISNSQLRKLINLLETEFKVYISSENKVIPEFEGYVLNINPKDILHILYFADMFIGDSQTMTSEAAVLGTPALRCNSFVERISVMEEKVNKYGLSKNYNPSNFDELLKDVEEFISLKDLKQLFEKRRNIMLEEKDDLNQFLYNVISQYPISIKH